MTQDITVEYVGKAVEHVRLGDLKGGDLFVWEDFLGYINKPGNGIYLLQVIRNCPDEIAVQNVITKEMSLFRSTQYVIKAKNVKISFTV
jgi:hypothetical protein